MKKNAFDVIDKEKEKEKDAKYKTEICKTFEEKGVCCYGNTCRFAHGKDDLLTENKDIDVNKFKIKKYYLFFKKGFCPYGSRCHFRHDEKKNIKDLDRLYYYTMLIDSESYIKNKFEDLSYSNNERRLEIFQEISENVEKTENNNNFNCQIPNNNIYNINNNLFQHYVLMMKNITNFNNQKNCFNNINNFMQFQQHLLNNNNNNNYNYNNTNYQSNNNNNIPIKTNNIQPKEDELKNNNLINSNKKEENVKLDNFENDIDFNCELNLEFLEDIEDEQKEYFNKKTSIASNSTVDKSMVEIINLDNISTNSNSSI